MAADLLTSNEDGREIEVSGLPSSGVILIRLWDRPRLANLLRSRIVSTFLRRRWHTDHVRGLDRISRLARRRVRSGWSKSPVQAVARIAARERLLEDDGLVTQLSKQESEFRRSTSPREGSSRLETILIAFLCTSQYPKAKSSLGSWHSCSAKSRILIRRATPKHRGEILPIVSIGFLSWASGVGPPPTRSPSGGLGRPFTARMGIGLRPRGHEAGFIEPTSLMPTKQGRPSIHLILGDMLAPRRDRRGGSGSRLRSEDLRLRPNHAPSCMVTALARPRHRRAATTAGRRRRPARRPG